MGQPIAIKDLGINSDGLREFIEVYKINIDSDNEFINVEYRIVYTGETTDDVYKIIDSGYTRYNMPEILYSIGEIITPEVDDGNGNITPAVISDGTQIKKVAKLKFNELRASQVGQMIVGMINLDLSLYPDLTQIQE